MLAEPKVISLADEQAERSVLGAIIANGLTAMDACIRLHPEHFYLSSHQTIFQTLRRLLAVNSSVDETILRDALGSDLDRVGGFAYLLNLSEGIYRNFDISQRVEMILEKWKLRRGRSLCNQFSARFESGESSVEILSELQAGVMDAIQESAEQDDPHVASYSDAAFEDLMARAFSETPTGLGFGLPCLDTWTYGMQPGHVVVVGARSGVGKSSLMKQAAIANAGAGIPTSLFSLEMTRQEILEGIWAVEAGVEVRKVTRPNLLNHAERLALQEAKSRVKKWPLRIYDSADLGINAIVAFARMDVRLHGVKLICVDYAQSVEGEGKDERTRVMDVSRKLTKMAKTEKCALMLLSQLRKVPPEQYSNPPTAADLRETDQMNNDAHMIVLLHRKWDNEVGTLSLNTDIIVPKIRRGKPGTLFATFNPTTTCFENSPAPKE